jgi:tryptophan halogenase
MKTDKIVIVGGGSAGWMTAATLIKAFPDKDITLIESENYPTVGVGESTIGGIRDWAKYIGLKEETFFAATDASYKMSIKFTDFYKKNSGSFHYPFGKDEYLGKENPYYQWQLKKYFYPETEEEDFVRCLFPASALFETNRFSLNSSGKFGNFNPDNDIAYHFDATKFGIWLRDNYCLPNGIKHVIGTVTDIAKDDGGIKHLILNGEEKIISDLFIDCTGFRSLLLSQTLQEPFESYLNMLPNNRAWATRIPYEDKARELEGFTNCTAISNGWCWNIPLWSRLGTGYVYSDKFISPEDAKEEFKQYLMSDKMVVPRTQEQVDGLEFKSIEMRVGIHKQTFVKNTVAIGLSAGFIEPLESNGLFSVHEFLFKLVDILQRGSINQFDREMYNIAVRQQFDDFARFVAMHYSLSHRDDTPYWKDITNRKFMEINNDPYLPQIAGSDAFTNLAWRYMDEWGHPVTAHGIPFISTGMKLNMLNDRRLLNLQNRYGKDYESEAKQVSLLWDIKKKTWADNAKEEDSLMEFLGRTYYGE